jgi:GDPmannose 4,6-dehydratase
VREFVVTAGAELGMRIEWRGEGLDEQGVDARSGRTVVRVDPRYFRPTEVETLLGDTTKARSKLGWQPEHTFQDLIREMVASDLEDARRDAVVAREGFRTYRYSE